MVEVLARLSGNSAGMVAAFTEGQAAAERFAATSEAAGKKVEASNSTTMASLQKMALVGAAVAGAVALVAVDMAAHFQKSTELLQTAGGLTEANLAKARDGILQISQATGVAASDLSDGMYIVSKVTKDAGDGLIILKAAAQGAVAEGVNMSTMTTALTSIMTTYNLKASDAVSTENALVAAAGASKATMQDFAGALSTVLPIAQSAGLSFDQVSGAIATMTQHGTSADEATQELRNGIQNLMAPNAVAISMMNQMGINSVVVAKNLGKQGLTGTLEGLREAVLNHIQGGTVLLQTMRQSTTAAGDMGTMLGHMTGPLQANSKALMDGQMTVKDYTKFLKGLDAAGNSQGHQFETLVKKSQGFNDAIKAGGPTAITYQQAMEKMMGGTTGLQTALMLTGDNMPGFQARVSEVGAAMKKTGTDISTNADTQATLSAQLARTKAMFEAMMITLGTGLIPVLNNFLTGVKAVMDFIGQNLPTFKGLVLVFGIATGLILAMTAAQWLWNAAMDANPVSLIIIAIAAFVAGIVIAYNNIGWFKDGVNTAFKIIGDVFNWWWNYIVIPVFTGAKDLITTVWNWLSDNVFVPWGKTTTTLGILLTAFWQYVVMPAFKGIQDAIHNVWTFLVAVVWNPWMAQLKAIGDAFSWLWNYVVVPVWSGIGHAISDAWNWIWNSAFSPLHQGLDTLGKAFGTAKDIIAYAWGQVKAAVAAPVHFIVDTVYTKGIAAVWNGISDAVGLGLHLPPAPQFATGGIAPGWSPGRDDQMIAVSGGEAIMRPEWTQAIGASNVHAMNAMARQGNMGGIRQMMGFAGGGIVGDILGGIGSTIANITGSIGSFLSNPAGAIGSMIKSPVDSLIGSLGSSSLEKLFMGLANNAIDSLTGKAKGFAAATNGGSGGGGTPVAGGAGGAAQWTNTVLQALSIVGQPASLLSVVLRRMNQESGGNPNAQNNWDSNAAAGIPSKGLMQVIPPTFAAYAMPGYNSNIFDPMSNILASFRYAMSRYGSLPAAFNQAGGYAMGGVIPTFDQGGTLAPGINVVNNATGANERLSNTTHGEGTTFVLEIPELGGRLMAVVKEVISSEHGAINRSLRNSPGVPQGGF